MSILQKAVVFAVTILMAGPALAEEKTYKEKYAEKVKKMEEAFFRASRDGKTVRGVLVEGNSLFNGTTAPHRRPYGKPYTDEELLAAKKSAERNSKVLLLARDGTLYYPTPPQGRRVTESAQAYRIPRALTEEQKKEGLFTWATLVPLVGRQVEVHGDIYEGYGGVRGISIRSIAFEGEYIAGGND